MEDDKITDQNIVEASSSVPLNDIGENIRRLIEARVSHNKVNKAAAIKCANDLLYQDNPEPGMPEAMLACALLFGLEDQLEDGQPQALRMIINDLRERQSDIAKKIDEVTLKSESLAEGIRLFFSPHQRQTQVSRKTEPITNNRGNPDFFANLALLAGRAEVVRRTTTKDPDWDPNWKINLSLDPTSCVITSTFQKPKP